jgi:hypothetical protein
MDRTFRRHACIWGDFMFRQGTKVHWPLPAVIASYENVKLSFKSAYADAVTVNEKRRRLYGVFVDKQ